MEISELFVFASFGNVRFSKFGNFSVITGISEVRKLPRKKFGKKFGKLFENVRKFRKFRKNDVLFEVLPCFSVKKFGKVQKKVRKKFGNFGKILEISEKFWKFRKNFGNFGNWFFRMFGNFGNFGNLEIPNFPKTLKKWRTIRTSEIQKYLFRLENRPESSAKSSEPWTKKGWKNCYEQ